MIQKWTWKNKAGRAAPALPALAAALFILVLSAVCAFPAFAQDTGPLTNRVQTVYNDENGLPTSEANAVLQTRDGYIWIGGYGGLVRFDGHEFYNFSTQESGLTTSGIRALFEDRRGNLWVGTNDKGVFLYQNGVFTPCEMPDGDLYRSIRCFAQDSSGTVFVGTSTGLAKIDGQNRMLPVDAAELNGQTIYTLSFDQNGALWGTAGSGNAFALKDGALRFLLKPGDLDANENYCILAHGNLIYIGTSGNRLLTLTLADDRYQAGSYRVKAYETGPVWTTNALCMTREGELWLGGNTGSGWFDREMGFHTLEDFQQNTFISCISQDYEGNLWLSSTQGGVFQLKSGKFSNANRSAGFEGKSINAVVRLGGLLYAASDYGLYIADEDWRPVENDLTRMLDGVRIRHLYVDSSGNLWISTYGGPALLYYKPATGNFQSFTSRDGLLSDNVRMVIELMNGDFAAATTDGVNILRNGRVIESYGQQEGLENPLVLCLLETSDGTLLVGSDGLGIYGIKNGKVSHYGKEQGLEAGSVLRMREDEKAGGVWISSGSGLYFMDSAGLIREITEFRYGIGSVFDIQVMEDDIWLMKSSGLIIVPRASLLGQQEMTAVQYGPESGLTANLWANSWNLFEDGILYLCSVNGVFLFDIGQLTPNLVPPKAAISEVTVQLENGETFVFQNPSSVRLPGDTRRLTIRFACLSFGGTPGTLEYCLDNFDKQPVVVTADRTESVSYTNLPGGSYVFHVNAKNADGIASERQLKVSITKELQLYERPAVWICLFTLAVLTVILGIRLAFELKTRKLQRRQQEYREITTQALRTIANTIDAKDPYTKGHSSRVAAYSLELARRLGLSVDEQERIYYIALMHDIGKIGIPDAILNKPGRLSDEEFRIMREHTRIGGDILKDFTALSQISDGALSHHENYDGSGYPDHKKGEDIPLVARIIRAADSYDAMATKRAYRDAMSQGYILGEFEKFNGIQFEPRIAKLMTEMIQEGFTPNETGREES